MTLGAHGCRAAMAGIGNRAQFLPQRRAPQQTKRWSKAWHSLCFFAGRRLGPPLWRGRERLRTWQCFRTECIARAAFARGHHRVICSNHDFADRAFAEHCRSSRNASGRMRSCSRRSWFQHSAGTSGRGSRRTKLLLRWCQSCRKADLKSRRAVRCTRPATPVPASAGAQAGRGIIAPPTCERNS